MLSTCCLQIVYRLCTTCCLQVVYRLSTCCLHVGVCGLSACCLRVVCGSSVGCLRVRCLRVVCGLSACCLRVGLTSSGIFILWISRNLETPYCYVMNDTYKRRLHIYCYVKWPTYTNIQWFVHILSWSFQQVIYTQSTYYLHFVHITSIATYILSKTYLHIVYNISTNYLHQIYNMFIIMPALD